MDLVSFSASCRKTYYIHTKILPDLIGYFLYNKSWLKGNEKKVFVWHIKKLGVRVQFDFCCLKLTS